MEMQKRKCKNPYSFSTSHPCLPLLFALAQNASSLPLFCAKYNFFFLLPALPLSCPHAFATLFCPASFIYTLNKLFKEPKRGEHKALSCRARNSRASLTRKKNTRAHTAFREETNVEFRHRKEHSEMHVKHAKSLLKFII